MIDTIIFDLEGIVIDTEKTWDSALIEFLKRRQLKYRREEIKHLVTGLSIFESVKVLKKRYALEGQIETLAKERITIIKDKLCNEVKFTRGFIQFFLKIDCKYKTCIATSLDRSLLNEIIEKIKLNSYFDNRIYSISEVGNTSKPNPAVFLYAAKELSSIPESCLVIEDSPAGLEGAKNAGMQCIGLTTTHNKEKLTKADFVYNTFQEIETHLKNINYYGHL